MNTEKYLEVLKKRFCPQLLEWCPDRNAVLMHDGAPCHRSGPVSRYLEDTGIEVLPWPGNSPDMNYIQSLWKVLKDKVARDVVTTKRQLIESMIQVWNHDEDIHTLAHQYITDMPNRIKALIAVKEL